MLIQALVLALLTGAGVIQVWHIYLMAFLLGVFKALDMPARQSFIVDMVEGKEDLTNAIGLNSAVHNGARTLGPALAGVAVAALGEAVAFLVNALSFLAVIFSLLAMRSLPHFTRVKDDRPVHTHMAEGVRYLFSQQTLLILMSLVAVNSFLSRPYTTLMPVFADTILKDSARPIVSWLCSSVTGLLNCRAPEALPLGMLLASVGIGAVTGALIVASLPSKFRRGRVLTLGNLVLPGFLLLFVQSRSLLFSCFLLMLVGMGQVLQNASGNTLLQITAPDELRGRVMSQYSLVTQGMTHLGGLQAGFMADWLTAPFSIGLGAAAALLYGAYVAVRYPRVRNMS
jgi:predicted MFS family arabinose efflux permease